MPTQPEGAFSEPTSTTFLAKLNTIPTKDVERYLAWQPVLHYYHYINDPGAPDIETLQGLAKETGWTAQVNSITLYLQSAQLLRDVVEVVTRLFQQSKVYKKHKVTFEALVDTKCLIVGTDETHDPPEPSPPEDQPEDQPEDPPSTPKRKRKRSVTMHIVTTSGKTMDAQPSVVMAPLYKAYWNIRHPGQRIIERGKTTSVKTTEELLQFWTNAFSDKIVAEEACAFMDTLRCLLTAK